MVVTYCLMWLLVLFLHEAGHLISAFALGVHVKRVGMSWKGMYIVRESGPPLANMMTTLGGPLLNVLLAMAWPAAHEFAMMNLIFGLANMIPLAGSDGQRAVLLLTRHSRPRAA